MANNDIHHIISDSDYKQWLQQLKSRYRQAQIKAASRVNEELLRYYWQLGADIDARGDENRYGTQFYYVLSRDMQEMLPGAEGFSESNLKYAVRFYKMYVIDSEDNTLQTSNNPIREQPVPELKEVNNQLNTIWEQAVPELKVVIDEAIFHIPWGHHVLILKKSQGNLQKALFYVHKIIENQWSRAMLLNMMGDKDGKGGLYEAQGKAITNFADTLPKPDTDLARDILKDPYNLQFLRLYENYQEQDLQLALEVKVVKFQPEFISKLNFYCSCVNHQLKAPEDGDTIGLLICKEKNDVVARWTLEGNQQQPIGISTYRISDLLPTDQQISDRIHQLEEELERLRKLQQRQPD